MGATIVDRWPRAVAILGRYAFVFAQKTPEVYVAPNEGIIDLGLAPYVQRVLNEATDAGADRFHTAFPESL